MIAYVRNSSFCSKKVLQQKYSEKIFDVFTWALIIVPISSSSCIDPNKSLSPSTVCNLLAAGKGIEINGKQRPENVIATEI